jgi:4-oxalocrotonate tautomerase
MEQLEVRANPQAEPLDRIRNLLPGRTRYKATVAVANVPMHDKFQVINRHAADEIISPEEGYLGMKDARDLIIIQVTWVSGRSIEVKKQFFQAVANEIHTRGGVRKEEVWINLVDTGREDWSFGNGEMQYGPKCAQTRDRANSGSGEASPRTRPRKAMPRRSIRMFSA